MLYGRTERMSLSCKCCHRNILNASPSLETKHNLKYHVAHSLKCDVKYLRQLSFVNHLKEVTPAVGCMFHVFTFKLTPFTVNGVLSMG